MLWAVLKKRKYSWTIHIDQGDIPTHD